MKNLLLQIKSFLLKTGDDVISPLYDGITLVGPYAIGVVLLLSTIWGIFLGVKYAKAEDASEKANLHQVLVNFIIGAATILVLISVIYAIRGPLARYIDG
jgi:predicted ABC-type exoprotein transport system permease subunit